MYNINKIFNTIYLKAFDHYPTHPLIVYDVQIDQNMFTNLFYLRIKPLCN